MQLWILYPSQEAGSFLEIKFQGSAWHISVRPQSHPFIATQAECFLMLVKSPIDRFHKTNGKVAALRFTRPNTNVPIEKPFRVRNSRSLCFGFETTQSKKRKLTSKASPKKHPATVKIQERVLGKALPLLSELQQRVLVRSTCLLGWEGLR